MVANEYQLPFEYRIAAEGVVSGRLMFDMGNASNDYDTFTAPCEIHYESFCYSGHMQ
jgi:hypothetical protein